MPYNLVREPWLPLRRRGGDVEWVEPWRVTDRGPTDDNPFVAVDSPRPDFNGALTEFLIGLVQTALPPPDERAWEKAWKEPPRPEELRAAVEKVAHAFDLDGPGPRFMQVKLPPEATPHSIDQLFIDQPGKKTLEDNKDLFNKRGLIVQCCPACTASALFTLQTYAPEGGAGKLTSLRGGGPLTTVILDDTLWETVWLNTFSEQRFLSHQLSRSNDLSLVFPWLDTSDRGNKQIIKTPIQADRTQAFWGMPRNIWLDYDATNKEGYCSSCGMRSKHLINAYNDLRGGIKYEGGWQHPLSPYYWENQNPLRAYKSPADGLSYRYWLGLALAEGAQQQGKKNQAKTMVGRAGVVSLFDERRTKLTSPLEGRARQFWAFGFDMAQNKARAWVDSRMPLVLVEPAHRVAYEQGVRALVDTAGQAASALARCLKEAWFGEGSSVKSNQGDLERLGQHFWATSESDFYDGLDRLKALLEQEKDFWSVEDTEVVSFKGAWLNTLQDHVMAIFEQYSQYNQIEQANPKRIALARKNLWFLVGTWAKKMREALDLPALERPAKQTKRGKGEES